MPTITKLYTMKEVAEHNSDDDCWIVVDGKVYDVTSYLDDHPGGADVLISATGKDATEEFEDAGHSKDARNQMKDYCIGELDPTPPIPEMEVFRKDDPLSSFFTSKTAKVWAIPAAVTVLGVSIVAAIIYARKK
ncbi:Cytochrome b5 [Rhynchospora pubera]|nr:Cytochrome b5 [Rhynchospora pubera]